MWGGEGGSGPCNGNVAGSAQFTFARAMCRNVDAKSSADDLQGLWAPVYSSAAGSVETLSKAFRSLGMEGLFTVTIHTANVDHRRAEMVTASSRALASAYAIYPAGRISAPVLDRRHRRGFGAHVRLESEVGGEGMSTRCPADRGGSSCSGSERRKPERRQLAWRGDRAKGRRNTRAPK